MKDVISGQLQLFASEKLGAENGKTEVNDYQAIKKFNSIVKSIGIYLEDLGSGGGGGGGGHTLAKNQISLTFPFPKTKATRRVEYGEELSDLFLKITNGTKHAATVMVKIETEQESLTREIILNKTYPPIRAGKKTKDGPFSFKIEKSKYTDGKCRLKARLINLNHPDYLKGHELDEVSHLFYIAQDPPLSKGPFREIKRSSSVTEEIKDKIVSVDAKVVPHPEGGYDLIMNVGHPIYKEKCKLKENEPDYEIELMAKKLPYVLLEENVEPFKGVSEATEILKFSGAIYSQILEKYYK